MTPSCVHILARFQYLVWDTLASLCDQSNSERRKKILSYIDELGHSTNQLYHCYQMFLAALAALYLTLVTQWVS